MEQRTSGQPSRIAVVVLPELYAQRQHIPALPVVSGATRSCHYVETAVCVPHTRLSQTCSFLRAEGRTMQGCAWDGNAILAQSSGVACFCRVALPQLRFHIRPNGRRSSRQSFGLVAAKARNASAANQRIAAVARIAVGTPIAGRPPHRSGRAQLRHPAPTSDE